MSLFPSSPFGQDISSADILATMQQFHGWEDRYRQVIQWGKLLPVMPDALKLDRTLVSGCESQVWLVSEEVNQRWHFCADSDSRIVRGLIAIVLAAFEGKTSIEIREFDMKSYFHQLGLLTHLSPSRGNGLKSIVDTIYTQVI
jgi:cysteine desulfuration protein SufE